MADRTATSHHRHSRAHTHSRPGQNQYMYMPVHSASRGGDSRSHPGMVRPIDHRDQRQTTPQPFQTPRSSLKSSGGGGAYPIVPNKIPSSSGSDRRGSGERGNPISRAPANSGRGYHYMPAPATTPPHGYMQQGHNQHHNVVTPVFLVPVSMPPGSGVAGGSHEHGHGHGHGGHPGHHAVAVPQHVMAAHNGSAPGTAGHGTPHHFTHYMDQNGNITPAAPIPGGVGEGMPILKMPSLDENGHHHPAVPGSPYGIMGGDVHPQRPCIVVQPHDVLCGRGGATNNHPGNRFFRKIVKEHQPDYFRAKKREKPNVAREIVSAIKARNPPGRFLKKCPTSGIWHEISDRRATEKASQALREGSRDIRTVYYGPGQENDRKNSKDTEEEEEDIEQKDFMGSSGGPSSSGTTSLSCSDGSRKAAGDNNNNVSLSEDGTTASNGPRDFKRFIIEDDSVDDSQRSPPPPPKKRRTGNSHYERTIIVPTTNRGDNSQSIFQPRVFNPSILSRSDVGVANTVDFSPPNWDIGISGEEGESIGTISCGSSSFLGFDC